MSLHQNQSKMKRYLVKKAVEAIKNPSESQDSVRHHINKAVMFKNCLLSFSPWEEYRYDFSCSKILNIGSSIYRCICDNKNFEHVLRLRFLLPYLFYGINCGIFTFRYCINPPFHLWQK